MKPGGQEEAVLACVAKQDAELGEFASASLIAERTGIQARSVGVVTSRLVRDGYLVRIRTGVFGLAPGVDLSEGFPRSNRQTNQELADTLLRTLFPDGVPVELIGEALQVRTALVKLVKKKHEIEAKNLENS